MSTDSDPLVDDLRELVEIESPTGVVEAIERCARAVAALGERLLGVAPDWHRVDGTPHLEWSFDGGKDTVLLLGHIDTV